MSSTPPEYRPGDYVPAKDRGPDYRPTWVDPAVQVQNHGGLSPEDAYRAIYGTDARMQTYYASWGLRFVGWFVDTLLSAVASVPLVAGYIQLGRSLDYETDAYGNRTVSSASHVSGATVALLALGGLIWAAFLLYNVVIRQGRTGYTFGKSVVGIRLVRISTGQPMGAGLCFVRQLAHYVDSLICYLGWFWPLWDSRRQTLGDKIMGTVVVVQAPQRAAT